MVRVALSTPGREISGVLGPWAQVEETLLLPGFDRPRRSVFTPPSHRGHGFARAVVATSLLEAQAAGARRPVLFVGEDNHAAQRCYHSLGYRRVGDYGLVVFEPSSRKPP